MTINPNYDERLDALVARIGTISGGSVVRALAARLMAVGAVSDDSLVATARNPELPAPVRVDACWLLPRMDIDQAADTLIALMSDPLESIREAAATGLGLVSDDRAAEILLASLDDDRSTPVRLAAIHALGIHSSPSSVTRLLGLVHDTNEDEDARADAAEALAHVEDDRVVSELIAALGDSSALVRYSAAYALGEQGSPEAIPALRELAASDPALTKYGAVAERARESVDLILDRLR